MPKKKCYITTAIPYVNAKPHLGFLLELVQADTIARFNRLQNKEVFFLTGTDENAQKNVLVAEKEGVPVKRLVDTNSNLFQELTKVYNISNDDFIRTTDKKRHWPSVKKLWELCEKSKDIYKKEYYGLYCVGCEAFVTEKDLENGLCPEHLKKPEKISEENYFFKLSKYQNQIKKLIENNNIKIIPESRKNEVLSFIKEGLEDFSISRPAERVKYWGVPVPNNKNQFVFVWYDALVNYISALEYHKNSAKFKKFWPADVHVIGKGIVRFHAIYWVGMLLSAKLKLPKSILVHGYLTVEGQKISKTLGNVIDPLELCKRFSIDSIRYFLLKEIQVGSDGDFSETSLIDRHNNELLNDLGNLVSRSLALAVKFNGKIEGKKELKLNLKKIEKLFEEYKINEALNEIWSFIKSVNKYVNDKKPWELESKKLSNVLYNLLESIRIISILISPFIPETAEKIS